MERVAKFSVSGSRRDDVMVVTVRGDVDMSQALEVRHALADVETPLVVDLHECTFMGSDGVRALLEGRRLAVERGQRFVLSVRPGSAVKRLLDVVGGATIFNIHDELEAAVRSASTTDCRRGGDRRRPTAA